jgi:hypothetical protein
MGRMEEDGILACRAGGRTHHQQDGGRAGAKPRGQMASYHHVCICVCMCARPVGVAEALREVDGSRVK